ncbi:MAG: hypothetical protein KAS72_04480 [Phycisphaerales bacterium]|nr:hypothetical protein [Phycisphaerales bacterium]
MLHVGSHAGFVKSHMRVAAVVLFALSALGCHSNPPDVFTFEGRRYEQISAAVIEAMRAEGFQVDRNDPRLGVFTSKPKTSPTLLEFFKLDNSNLAQTWESTVNQQRRRVRVTVEPADLPETPDAETLAAMTQVTVNPLPPTFEQPEGLLDLRVTVFVDRAHKPLWRVETTTRRLSTHARDPALEDRHMQPIYWEPISRDPLMERRLMRRIIECTIASPQVADAVTADVNQSGSM